jgi:hypothetical protein
MIDKVLKGKFWIVIEVEVNASNMAIQVWAGSQYCQDPLVAYSHEIPPVSWRKVGEYFEQYLIWQDGDRI